MGSSPHSATPHVATIQSYNGIKQGGIIFGSIPLFSSLPFATFTANFQQAKSVAKLAGNGKSQSCDAALNDHAQFAEQPQLELPELLS